MSPKKLEILRLAMKNAWHKIHDWANGSPPPDGSPVNSPLDMLREVVRQQLEKIDEALSPEALKIAMCYQERTAPTLTFEELVAQIKDSYSLKPGMQVCILKTVSDVTILDVMACDEAGEVNFSLTRPWLRFVVADIDVDLVDKFGSKSMLVLK